VNATVFGLLLISDALKLQQVLAFFLLEHVQLFFDSTLLVLKKLNLKLVDFLLLIFVDVLELSLFECKFTVFIFAKCICRHKRHGFSILSNAFALLFSLLLQLLNFFLLCLDISKAGLQFQNGLAFFPHFYELSTLTTTAESAKFDGLFI